jgi:hypothetical protein
MSIAVDRHIKSYLWCQLLISVDIKDQFSIIKRIHEHRSKLVRPRSGAAVVDLPLIYAAACQGWRTLPTITEAHVACRRGPPSRPRLPHPWATVPTSTVHPHCRRRGGPAPLPWRRRTRTWSSVFFFPLMLMSVFFMVKHELCRHGLHDHEELLHGECNHAIEPPLVGAEPRHHKRLQAPGEQLRYGGRRHRATEEAAVSRGGAACRGGRSRRTPWRKEPPPPRTVEEGTAALGPSQGCCRAREREKNERERERVKNRWLHVVKIRMRTPPCWTREREERRDLTKESTQSACEPFGAADWSKEGRCGSGRVRYSLCVFFVSAVLSDSFFVSVI